MRYLLCFACLMFAACDGTGGIGDGSNRSEGTGTPSGFSNCSGEPPPTGGSKLSIRSVDEIEPNDEVSTAYALDMPTPASPGDFVGIVIEGSIHDTVDRSDIFAFTLSRTRRVFFKLCESSCETGSYDDKSGNPDGLPVWVAHFSVLDADGKTIVSTAGHNPAENYGDACINAGVIMYIAVHANNTLNLVQPYRISAIETDY